MKEKDVREKLKDFVDGLKKYQQVCRSIWGTDKYRRDTDEFQELCKLEEEQRENLTYQWGTLEVIFKKLGIETMGSAYGRQFGVFESGLDGQMHDNPIKRDSLRLAVQSAVKALGKVESVDLEEVAQNDIVFHPRIKSGKCLKLYNSGHFPEAVENSFKVVRDRLRELTGHETGNNAFGKGGLYIRGASAPHVDADFQDGVKFLSMSLDKFRNEKSHFADGGISDPKRAMMYLNLSNLLMSLLDEAEIRKD